MSFFYIVLAIGIGGILAFVINRIASKKTENNVVPAYVNIFAYILCIIFTLVFFFFSFVKNYAHSFLQGQISNIENKIDEASPGLAKKEFETSEMNKAVEELNNFLDNLKSDEKYGKISEYFLKLFLNNIPHDLQTMGKGTLKFMQENENISIDLLLKIARLKAEEKVSTYCILGKNLVVILFIVFLIIYICVIRYFKKSNSLYNKSIVFGAEAENLKI